MSAYDPTNSYEIPTNTVLPIVIPGASPTSAGVLSAADKAKLDTLAPYDGAVLYTCAIGVTLRQAVYVSANDKVDPALATVASAKYPSVGLVIAKPTPTTCYVVFDEEVTGFVGLVAGVVYYLSAGVAGAITATAPTTTGQVVQKLGFAKDPTTLIVLTTTEFVVL